MIKEFMRKTMAVLVSITMVLIVLPTIPVHATQTRKNNFSTSYTLTGNGAQDIINVAMAQIGKTGSDLGYSEEWCADFVSDCADLAGQGDAVPRTGAVSNEYTSARPWWGLRQTIIQAGGYNVGLDNAQPGDIVFFSGHVEIVYSGTGSGIVSIGGNTGRGDSCYTRTVCSPRKHGNPVAVLRPNYSNTQLDAPSLTINKNFAKAGEEISIEWNDVEGADSYWLHIYKNGEDYINQSLDKSLSFTHSYSKGNYTAYVVSIRGSREALSSVSFSVYDSVPAAPKPNISKDHFEINEMVDITWAEVPETDYYWLHIYRNGEDYENKSLDKALSYSAQYPEGEYRAYIVSGNGLGETLSYVDFTVHSDPPDKPDLRIAKNRFTINEDVTVSWDAIANADSYWLHSYRNGEDYENKSIGTDLSYTAQYPVGEYTLFIVPINAAGETLSSVDFTVHDSKPEAPKPTIPKSSFSTDERINIKWNKTADTDSYWLHIYKDGEDYVNQSLMLSLDYSAKYPAGNYTAYIVSCNAMGETLSSVDFSVYVNGDCNSDGEFNISDVVLLQKWLLAVPDTHMENWQAADLCEDDRLDVFDLCLMKRQLIYGGDNR